MVGSITCALYKRISSCVCLCLCVCVCVCVYVRVCACADPTILFTVRDIRDVKFDKRIKNVEKTEKSTWLLHDSLLMSLAVVLEAVRFGEQGWEQWWE